MNRRPGQTTLRKRRALLIAVWLPAAAAWAAEPNTTTAKAREALRWCAAADAAPLAERVTILSRGLQCAEEAADTDPGDATAHFAVFCNLGKLTRLRRDTAGWLALLADVAADDVNDALIINVTGAAGSTLSWTASVTTSELN